jgi:hypothetical protein
VPVMAVNNENPREPAGDYRSRPRWSAGKKMEAVLRLLRGKSLEVLSRELGASRFSASQARRNRSACSRMRVATSALTGSPNELVVDEQRHPTQGALWPVRRAACPAHRPPRPGRPPARPAPL